MYRTKKRINTPYDLLKGSLFASGKSLAMVWLLVTGSLQEWCRINIALYLLCVITVG